MAAFLNNCRFIPAAGGTTDWVYSSTVGGCQSPALAGVVDGRKYKFLAISSDLAQWEIAEGTYTAASGTFARTTVLYNSSGTGAATGQSGVGSKISFITVPNVAIVGVKEDLISVEEANAFTTAQMAQARANIGVLKKNYVVNSGMQVSQENGTTAGTVSNHYAADQWLNAYGFAAGSVSFAQVASPTPGGSTHRIRLTMTGANASPGASDYLVIEHRIEGLRVADLRLGSASAKAVTLQFGCKGPAGIYSVAFRNNGYTRGYQTTFAIAAAEASIDVVKTITIALDQAGTWAADSSFGLEIAFGLMAGSSFLSGSQNTWGNNGLFGVVGMSNFAGINGNVFELFDVGLYEGTAAPSFQLPDFASELVLCQRYWEKSYDYGVAPGSNSTSGQNIWFIAPQSNATYTIDVLASFKATKRATPTITTYSPQNGAAGKARDGANGADVSSVVIYVGHNGFTWGASQFGSITNINLSIQWTANARL